MTAGVWLNSDLFLGEGEPVNARSGFSFAEQIIEELGRRIFRFLCRGDRISAAVSDFRANLLRATSSQLVHPKPAVT